MASTEIEEAPILSYTHPHLSDEHIEPQRPTLRNRSLSMSIPLRSMDEYVGGNHLVSHTGPLLRRERASPLIQTHGPLYISGRSGEFDRSFPLAGGQMSTIVDVEESGSLDATDQKDWRLSNRNKNLLRSCKLGLCDDLYCTTCPVYYNHEQAPSLSTSEAKVHNMFSGGAKGWMRRPFSFLGICILGIVNPHAKVVRKWNKCFEISCLAAIFVDPLFFFLLSVQKENRCIILDWSMAAGLVVVRSITGFIYLCHMLFQFRVAFVPPESTVVGGELVDQPKKIAFHYVFGNFLLDVFAILPFQQIMILFVSHSSPNSGYKLLSGLVCLQYPTRYYRCKPLLNGDSESGMPVKNASIIFCRNLFICILAGHIVGSWWYLIGIQRVNDCLRNICYASVLKNCQRLTYCGRGGDIGKLDPSWLEWLNISSYCFESDKFSYGMFEHVVILASGASIVPRSAYSFFWGLQQISTLAGNLVPSSYLLEILFGISVVVCGLFLFALVVGDVLSVSQAIGWRRYEMQRRGTDVEQWMHNKRLPKQLRRKIRQSERFYWSATHGVNEKALLENLSEDLQREIYHHCFSFIKEVQIFAQMEGPILDAICGRLRQKLFIKGSKILDVGGVVDKMFFIVRGRIMSDDVDGNHISLSHGNLCGEEILSWCLGHSSVNKDGKKIRVVGQQFLSRRTVTCLTNVNTYSLRASDLDEVAAIFPIFLRRIQNTVRRESPYWRGFAARSIQVAWRYRKWRLRRAEISTNESR